MPPSDDEEVILTRAFERDDGAVLLTILRPVPFPHPDLDADKDNPPWRCGYAISFPDGEVKRFSGSVGVDSVQALLLAFAAAQGDLTHVGNGTLERRPPIRWLGEPDLGLTINHFDF